MFIRQFTNKAEALGYMAFVTHNQKAKKVSWAEYPPVTRGLGKLVNKKKGLRQEARTIIVITWYE